jgi:hypothetical protein
VNNRKQGGVGAYMECAMSDYRVKYYKNLLSSDGHQFKCLQQQIDVPNVESAEKAEETAARQFESLRGLHSLKWFADVIEVERVNQSADELGPAGTCLATIG